MLKIQRQCCQQYIIIMIKFLGKSLFKSIGSASFFHGKLQVYFSRKRYYQEQTADPIQKIVGNLDEFKDMSQQQQTKEVLKTYLQVIPPHKIQQLFQSQATDISEEIQICSERSLSQQQIERVYKKIKKNVHIMKIEDLGRLLEQLNNEKNFGNLEGNSEQKSLIVYKKIEGRIINIAKKKVHKLSLEQIVNFMYKLVKLNKKEFEFMKEVERVIIEEKIPINYPMIRKILWSFTHLDVGSSVLYSHLAKTIKIGQHELHPLELAQSAYMLSKVSQNVTGGYGTFLIAQKHLEASLPRLSFHELTKASSLMLTQNLGSNNFQMKLEEKLYKKFPNRISLGINDLVSLLKATSSYYFKYKQNALLHMLKAATERLAEHATLEQFQDIVWSWGRAGKGDKQLWEILEACLLKKHLNFLKPRQLAFLYHAIANTQYSSDEILEKLEQKFFKIVENTQVKPHYIIKFLLGMEKRKSYNVQAFLRLSQILCEKIPSLTNKELMSFVKIINESDLHYASKDIKQEQKQPDLIEEIEKHLRINLQESINKKIFLFKISQIVEILYMWIKLDLKDQSKSQNHPEFTSKLFELLQTEIVNIPKNVFIKAFLCFVIKDQYKPAFEMIPILYELMKYGPIGYFFSPFETPLLAYCLLHLQVNGEGQVKIRKKLLDEICDLLEDIDPVILNEFVRNGYEEAVRLKEKYKSITQNSP